MLAQLAWTLRPGAPHRRSAHHRRPARCSCPAARSEVSVEHGAGTRRRSRARARCSSASATACWCAAARELATVDRARSGRGALRPARRRRSTCDGRPGRRGLRRRPRGAASRRSTDPARAVRRWSAAATDLLRPAWDFAGRVWLVDRDGGGARVLVRAGDDRRAPGGGPRRQRARRRRSFLVSRDGTRLVAVRPRDGDRRCVVSRVHHDDQGRVARAPTPGRHLASSPRRPARSATSRWRSPTSIAVLHRLTGDAVPGAHRRRSTARPTSSPRGPLARRGRRADAWSAPRSRATALYAVHRATAVDRPHRRRARHRRALDPG